MTPPRRSGLLAFAVLTALGCGNDDDPMTDATLEAGSKVVGVDGVTVGAPIGALEESTVVQIERIDTPAASLVEGIALTGATYRIATEAPLSSPSDTTFVVGLPLPDSVDPADSVIAALAPEGQVLDGPDGDTWLLLASQHEPDTGLLLFSAPSLGPEGLVVHVAVTNEPGATSPEEPPSISKGGTPLVEARCGKAFSNRVTGCTSAARAAIEGEFETMYTLLQTAGYPEPRLDRAWALATSTSWLASGPSPAPYLVTIRPCVTNGNLGLYSAQLESLWVCITQAGVDDKVSRTMRHELFHAAQYAFPAVRTQRPPPDASIRWGIEGQAAIAERSSTTQVLGTPEYPIRILDESFYTDRAVRGTIRFPFAYMVQDFWGFLGAQVGGGIGFLIPFLERGHLASAVDEALMIAIANPDIPDLATAYWAFAKNQAFEWQVPFDRGATTSSRGACELYDADDNEVIVFSPSVGLSGGRTLDSQSVRIEELTPLSGSVVSLQLVTESDYLARVAVESTNTELRYKVFDDEGSGCAGDVEDASRVFQVEMTGSERQVSVLLANPGAGEDINDVFVRVSVVELAVDPERLSLGGSGGAPAAASFSILNGGADPVSFTAVSGASWLTITQNPSGVVPRAGSIEVTLEAACPSEGSFETEVALEFEDARGVPIVGDDVPDKVEVTLDCDDSNMGNACEAGSRSYSVSVTWTRSGGGGLPGIVRVDASGGGVENCDGNSCEWTRSLRHVETRLDAEGEQSEFVVTDETGFESSSPFSGVPFTSLMLGSFCSQQGEVFLSTTEAGVLSILAPDGSGSGTLSWACAGCSCFDGNRASPPDGCCPIMCQPSECEVPDNFIPVPSQPGCTAGTAVGCGDYVPGFIVEGGEICDGFISSTMDP